MTVRQRLTLALLFAAAAVSMAQPRRASAQQPPPDAAAARPAPAEGGEAPTAPANSDIDQAADSVAVVAQMEGSSSSSKAEQPTESVDLESLGLSVESGVTDTSLSIYGFAAVSFLDVTSSDRQVLNQFLAKEGSFFLSDVNIYLAKEISEQWRTMLEVRLTYAPNGRVLADGTIEPNQSYDQGLFGRNASWGGVNIERGYLEYDIFPYLTIQGGVFLTPYGIWNVDHGAPAIIPIVRPYILNEQLFPERQAGLHFYGRLPMGNYALGYHATLSNGRGFYDQFRDLDDSKAVGGRLVFETPWLGGLRFGAAIYLGQFVDRDSDTKVVNPETKDVDNVTPRGVRYKEIAYAGDITWDLGSFHLQGEIISRNYGYLDGARAADGAGFRPDSYSLGGYALVGYRFPFLWNVMPFVLYQRYMREESSTSVYFAALENYHVGLNFRPLPALTFKIQFGQSWVPEGKPPVDDEILDTLATQASWVF